MVRPLPLQVLDLMLSRSSSRIALAGELHPLLRREGRRLGHIGLCRTNLGIPNSRELSQRQRLRRGCVLQINMREVSWISAAGIPTKQETDSVATPTESISELVNKEVSNLVPRNSHASRIIPRLI